MVGVTIGARLLDRHYLPRVRMILQLKVYGPPINNLINPGNRNDYCPDVRIERFNDDHRGIRVAAAENYRGNSDPHHRTAVFRSRPYRTSDRTS